MQGFEHRILVVGGIIMQGPPIVGITQIRKPPRKLKGLSDLDPDNLLKNPPPTHPPKKLKKQSSLHYP